MAKIRKEVIAHADGDKDTFIRIIVDVNINADGQFTTTISKDDAELIESYGIELENNRVGRSGFFQSDTMAGLIGKIYDVLKDCLNYKVVSQEPVILYNFDTVCSYCLNNQTGDIVPNGYFVGEGDFKWKSGTKEKFGWDERGYAMSIAVKPRIKRTVEYGNGKQKIFYDAKNDWEKGSYMEWLNGLPDKMWDRNYAKEIAGTEENARFFVLVIKQICRINEQIGDILKQDKLAELIQSQLKLEVLG